MLRITRRAPTDLVGKDTPRQLVLPYAQRCRSRLRATTRDGTEVGLTLTRDGQSLRGGDLLLADDGSCVAICAAIEPLYRVQARADAQNPHFELLRAAYHLGNRHVALELAPGELKLERDPVLREMLQRLGLVVHDIEAPFEPEAGAYGGGHRHDHDDSGGSVGEELSRAAHHHHDHA